MATHPTRRGEKGSRRREGKLNQLFLFDHDGRMGVNSLWELLGPAGRVNETLCTLADRAFRTAGIRSLRIWVDASLWLYHCDVYSGMDAESLGAYVVVISIVGNQY